MKYLFWLNEGANKELTRNTFDYLDSEKSINQTAQKSQVSDFTQKLLIVIQNFIPHAKIVYDSRDFS